MKKARKSTQVAGKKMPASTAKTASKGLSSAKTKTPLKRPSGETLFDYKKIQNLCDFKTPISEWAIPMLQESGLKTSELGERIRLEQVNAAFENALNSLCRFISQGSFEDSAKLIPLLLATAQGRIMALEKMFPNFGQLQVTNRIIAHFAKEAERKRKTKQNNNSVVSDKDKYRLSCETEILKVVIMHRAGWRRHPFRATPLPFNEFGSAAGKNDWQAWMRNYLAELHSSGLLRANPTTKFFKEGKARNRSKVRDDYFNAIYSKASDASFELLIDLNHRELELHAALKTWPDCYSFLTVMATEHPECAPKGFVPHRIKIPEILC